MTWLGLFLLLTTTGSVRDACNDGEQTVSGVVVKITGRNCRQPASTRRNIMWWTSRGAVGKSFEATPEQRADTTPLGVYDPRVVWVAAEGASRCARGAFHDDPPCYGAFELPCATREYALHVSDPHVRQVSVHRGIGRKDENGRCDLPGELVPPSRAGQYPEGAVITVVLYTADSELCQFRIDLDSVGQRSISPTCDTRVGYWPAETRPPRVTPNLRVSRPRNVPASVTLVVEPVP